MAVIRHALKHVRLKPIGVQRSPPARRQPSHVHKRHSAPSGELTSALTAASASCFAASAACASSTCPITFSASPSSEVSVALQVAISASRPDVSSPCGVMLEAMRSSLGGNGRGTDGRSRQGTGDHATCRQKQKGNSHC